jgi:hypothetical protein
MHLVWKLHFGGFGARESRFSCHQESLVYYRKFNFGGIDASESLIYDHKTPWTKSQIEVARSIW